MLRSSSKKIDFLDVLIEKDAHNIIKTKLFEKETNAYQYLHRKSNHPRHTKEKIAYGLALRAKRICSLDTDY